MIAGDFLAWSTHGVSLGWNQNPQIIFIHMPSVLSPGFQSDVFRIAVTEFR